jgi:ABC-2 type transport system permease protein
MNKVFLIIEREFLNRVGKKSFLIATILIPLIFPAIIALLLYVNKSEEETAKKPVIHVLDESRTFTPDTSKYIFISYSGSLEQAKTVYQQTQDMGLLYIPAIDINNPQGITLYSKQTPSMQERSAIRRLINAELRELKMEKRNVKQSMLDSLETHVDLRNVNISPEGIEKKNNSDVLYGVGMTFGILMYMFIFIYGAQIMQGIIEEKTSKVVEVIVSSVRPFQLMMGKILGLASVGLLQFLIWAILMISLTWLSITFLGGTPQQQAMQGVNPEAAAQQAEGINAIVGEISALPWAYIIFCFLFYFLGGYLLYGALFAAVGSSVDSPAEAQQFMFPITIPLLVSYMGLFIFILEKPHSPVSVWLSIIPFTSPIAMMGRLGSDVPLWQLVLSMVFLIGGFILTTWVAGRIYRVGILMSGTKVNYKVLAKWFLMKG